MLLLWLGPPVPTSTRSFTFTCSSLIVRRKFAHFALNQRSDINGSLFLPKLFLFCWTKKRFKVLRASDYALVHDINAVIDSAMKIVWLVPYWGIGCSRDVSNWFPYSEKIILTTTALVTQPPTILSHWIVLTQHQPHSVFCTVLEFLGLRLCCIITLIGSVINCLTAMSKQVLLAINCLAPVPTNRSCIVLTYRSILLPNWTTAIGTRHPKLAFQHQ